MKTFFSAAAMTLVASTVSAETIGFQLNFSGDTNVPIVTVTNTSDLAQLTGLTLTLGDTSRNFDAAYNEVLGSVGTFTRLSPDDRNGGARSDQASYSFTGFDASEVFAFQVDVDVDNGNTVEDYRTSVLQGGTFQATFAGGFLDGPLSIDLTAQSTSESSYSYSTSINGLVSSVPLPASGVLLLGAVAAVAGARRRKA